MRRLGCLLLLALTCPPAAAAQAPPGAQFAGGSITPSLNNLDRSSDVGITVGADGRSVTVRAMAAPRCARTRFTEGDGRGTARLAADGSFAVTVRGRRQVGARRQRLRVTGTVDAAGARGTIRAVVRISGGRVCRSTFPWRAVPLTPPAGAPTAAPAGALLLGSTSDSARGPFGFNLRVSADGRRIDRSLFTARRGCRRAVPPEETNYNPRIAIRPDGSFANTELWRVRIGGRLERSRVVITGQFVADGVTGTVRWTVVARSPRTGRVVDRCDTGPLTFSAVVVG